MRMSWRRRTAGLLSALFIAVTGTACTETAKGPSEGVAIWRVKDTDTTVYLFGTVHVLKKDLEWKSPAFEKVWKEVETLYMEADVSPEAQMRIQSLIPELGFNAPGVTLDSFLSEEGKADVAGVAASIGLPVETLQPLRPWLASLLMTVQLIVSHGGDPASGVETILTRMAKDKGMQPRYFETAEQQVRLLASPTDQDAAKSFELGLKQFKENPNIFEDIVTSWKTGNTDKMTELLIGSTKDAPETYQSLFVDRNKAWAKEIDRVLDEEKGTFLVAVGAGHLTGPDSVQVQLKAKGHDAERM